MPELPEVETIVRDLNHSLLHKIFSDVIVQDTLVLRQPKDAFVQRIKAQSIAGITRRGKAVIVHLSSGEFLVIQLMMTGQLIANGQKDPHTRIIFKFSDGTWLLYNDQRRFGQLRVVANLSAINYFNILGPEPLLTGFDLALMRKAFQNTKRPIKNLLLDHTFVAGIGNIYACEILFRSQISPQRQARRINPAETRILHRMTRAVLRQAIAQRGSSLRNYRDGDGQKGRFNERLSVYARQGLPCPRCREPILRIIQAGRSTFYCGKCQK